MQIRFSIIIVFIIAFATDNSAQITPDSLCGTYAGVFYWRHHPDDWIIREDTIYVKNVDSSSCLVEYINWSGKYTQDYLHTEYSFCNGDVYNWYTLFHSGDSVSIVYDNYGPPPGDELYSHRFFGKKIDTCITTGLLQLPKNNIKIYPNPSSKVIYIDGINYCCVDIMNLRGQLVYSKKGLSNQNKIDISDLLPGIYIIKIKSNQNLIVRKIVKR